MSKGSESTHIRSMSFLCTILIACTLVIGSSTGHVDAGVWDTIKQYYSALRVGEFDGDDIPDSPVEIGREFGLVLLNKVELQFDNVTPGIGEVQWIGVTPEGTMVLSDLTARQAHEFSLVDGRYIRSFGRSGRGPGEYSQPGNLAISHQGQVYLLDLGGRILRYDRSGDFKDRTRIIQVCQVLTGRNGGFFALKVNRSKIIELQRLDPTTWTVIDRTPLSTKKQSFISYRMTLFAKMCYNSNSGRIYYLGPNDYKVIEISTDTNEVVRQFGHRPDGFMTLPERYQGIGRGTDKDMMDLWRDISCLSSMTLIQDRYLIVSYTIDLYRSPNLWLVYDLNSAEGIKVHFFNTDAKERLATIADDSLPLAAWGDSIVVLRPPSEERSETSNGTVETYKLSIKTDDTGTD